MSESSYWDRFARKRLSRRRALRGMALGAVGVGLAACAPSAAPASPAPAATSSSGAAAPATAAPAGETSAVVKTFKYWNYIANKPNFSDVVKRGGVAKLAWSIEPAHLDPTASTSFVIPMVVGPVYNRLVRAKYGTEMVDFNNYGFELTGDLAESWTSSPDKTEWTFKLRQGVKWQNLPPVNGRELVADDIVFSYGLYQKSPIWATFWADVAKIEAVDKYTVKIGLKEAVAYFPRLPLTYHFFMILPKEVADKDGDFKKTAIGTGAFILKEWVPKTKTVHVKNPDYFRKGRPFLDGFEISFVPDPAAQLALYRGGEIHYGYPGLYEMTREQADALLRTHPDTVVMEDVPSYATWGMAVRLDKPPFNDVRVRRAMSLALNRQGMISAFKGATGHILPSTRIHDFYDAPPKNEDAVKIWPWLRFDPDEAKKLLAEAGFPNGFKATADHFPQTSALGAMSLLAQQDLKKVGIDIEIKTWDAASWNSQDPLGPGRGGYNEMTLFSAPPGGGLEMDEYTRLYMHSKATNNIHRINDPKLDEWTEAQRKELDPAKRKALIKQILDYANDQMFGIPFAEQSRIIAYSPKLRYFLTNWVNLWPHWGGQMWEEFWLSDK